MNDRNVICKYYQSKGQCAKGRDAAVYGICQHCALYEKKEGARPFRYNNKKRNLERIHKKEMQME